jgi:signal transduction histidine kinase
VAEDQGFALTVYAPEGLNATLHRELISQALGNLIENALKYADGGKSIILAANTGGAHLTLSVADDGPGIPAERTDEAKRRFGRLDPARHLTGSGLGLSLVEAVARLHGGDIALDDNAPGLRVSVTVKRSM